MSSSDIQTKILRRKINPEDYRVYRAGLEWDLTDPIVIETRDDLKSEYRWRDKLEPYYHQVSNLITFCRRLPVTLIADDVGLGKTISAGLIISELIARSRLSKILIVCPKLLGRQWKEELNTKFDIPAEIVKGKDLISANPKDVGAVITTYQSAREYLDLIPQDRFQMLILDEAHKLRNLYGVEKTPKVAKCFKKALEERRFQFVLMLTATPIQNRLWDIYSLVDLLTVARGHQNPFGSEGMFARRFIADTRDKARQLAPKARDEFRSIVYSYMSRIRRGDAKLYFPSRVVQLHKVDPTEAELRLIAAIAEPIQNLNKLAQISILQALASSPDALMAQLKNMARKGTVPQSLSEAVIAIVTKMPLSAKLRGLGLLIEGLKQENPEQWRLVVFTGRIETQTTIQIFLEKYGLKVGIINGSSGSRNQDAIERFRKNPPDCHVIVSTEAGSEGINLQVANVLVNYDLPWNPMIVEQRIGRVQRLASEHASVAIFNIMLRGTFEEYIVGRLMEKLQMASHAIGDIESLLEASGVDGEVEAGFKEKIRQLVMAALTGKDVKVATEQAVQSIENAKAALEREENNINEMLGSMDEAEYVGPRAPTLPPIVRSMESRDFTLLALKSLGAKVSQDKPNLFLAEENGGREYIRFEENSESGIRSTLYSPGAPAFLRLVARIIATGIYDVEDLDVNPSKESEKIANEWVISFGGMFASVEIEDVHRCFDGTALIRTRATVAHDSYERLVEVSCASSEHHTQLGRSGLGPLPPTIESGVVLGLDKKYLTETALLDPGISEFSRFYLERRQLETRAAADDERKRKKLEDEFTPRFELTLVAASGRLHRQIKVRVRYKIDADFEYENTLGITPHDRKLHNSPQLSSCSKTGKIVPKTCLKICQITNTEVLQHLLTKSEMSGRLALPEFIVTCTMSQKRILKDEAELSDVSGNLVAAQLLKKSGISGKRAEPKYFGFCEFTGIEVLNTELAVSEVSGKRYRVDEQIKSSVSGKSGYKLEFIVCYETGQSMLLEESEQCQVTGKNVRKGILQVCSITQKTVLSSELEQCAATGKRALKNLLVTSNLNGARILEEVAVRSATGKFCAPLEAKSCSWSGQLSHPEDMKVCRLTDLSIRFPFLIVSLNGHDRLKPLFDLLNGTKRTTDERHSWESIAKNVSELIDNNRCSVEASVLSPDRQRLAVFLEVRKLLGLMKDHVGFIYDLKEHSILGRLAYGKLTPEGWVARK